jgi:hypothetical protein
MFDLQANFNMVRCINMIYQTRLHIQSDCTVTSGKASHGGLLVGGYISSPLGARDHNSKEKGLDTVTVSSKTPNYLDRFGKRNNDACRCSLIRSCSKKKISIRSPTGWCKKQLLWLGLFPSIHIYQMKIRPWASNATRSMLCPRYMCITVMDLLQRALKPLIECLLVQPYEHL